MSLVTEMLHQKMGGEKPGPQDLNNPPTSLINLPTELQHNIFLFLHPLDVISVGSVREINRIRLTHKTKQDHHRHVEHCFFRPTTERSGFSFAAKSTLKTVLLYVKATMI